LPWYTAPARSICSTTQASHQPDQFTMSCAWKTGGPKFYKGNKMESPWNNDLHHMRMVENESHYYKMIDEDTFKPVRNRNPLSLSLKEMCNDETDAAKFATRQTNGIKPCLSVRSEMRTGRKCDKVNFVSLLISFVHMLLLYLSNMQLLIDCTCPSVATVTAGRHQADTAKWLCDCLSVGRVMLPRTAADRKNILARRHAELPVYC